MSTPYTAGYTPYPAQPGYPAGGPTNPGQGTPGFQYAPPPAAAPYPQQAGYQPPPAGYQPPPAPPQYGGFGHSSYKPPEQPTPVYTVNGSDNDNASDTPALGFSEKTIRKAFVRKVFSILTLQLIFTVGLTALFIFEEHVKFFVQNNIGVYISAYITFFVLYFVLVCCPSVRRNWPTNIILLGIFTIVLGYMVATISSFHDTQIVLMAAGICAGSCLGIIIFSFHTKFDFTTCGGVLCILCWVLFLFGILAIFTRDNILQTVYAGAGALLFMAFLAYDTQMVMGGKKYQLSPEEYIFAALQLYLDVVYIFLFIMSLLGGGKK